MKSQKLNLNKDFRRLYARGHSYVHPAVVSYIIPNNKNIIRYGITTGKKIGCAVMRNRARRLIEAAATECFAKMSLQGADIVFVARSRTVSVKSTDIKIALEQHFKAEGLLP